MGKFVKPVKRTITQSQTIPAILNDFLPDKVEGLLLWAEGSVRVNSLDGLYSIMVDDDGNIMENTVPDNHVLEMIVCREADEGTRAKLRKYLRIKWGAGVELDS